MDSAPASLDVHFNQLPGKTKPPTVTLKRGKDGSMNFWSWHEPVRGGNLRTLSLSATLIGSAPEDHLEIAVHQTGDTEMETVIRCEAVPPSPPSVGRLRGTVLITEESVAPQATIELKVGNAVIGTAKTGDKGEYEIDIPDDDYPAVAALLSGAATDKPLTIGLNVKPIDA